MRLLLDKLGSITEADTGNAWSGARLRTAVTTRALTLSAQGIGPGDRILIYHGGSAEFFADLLAVWQTGACAVCLNPGLTQTELENIVDFIEPRALLHAPAQDIPHMRAVSTMVLADACLGKAAHRVPEMEKRASLDDDALILFTSGTTGTPKGAVLSYRALTGRIALNQSHIPAGDMGVTLCPLPTHFGHGLIGNCLTPLLAGHSLVLMSGSDIRRVASLGDVIDMYGVSFMSSVPAMWKLATKVSRRPAKNTLRRIHVGSAPFSADLWRNVMDWAGVRNVVNMYGITEASNWIAGASAEEFAPEDGLIGRTWGGMVAVREADGSVCASGHGEILVQSPALMLGYYKLPELTASVLKDGWFHTGDIGTVDEVGVVRLTGRKKFEINRAGIKVHPEDIDMLLERHPAVREACAFGIADEVAGEIVGVAVCPAVDAQINTKELQEWCMERIAREKVPERWFLVREIPKTDRGKINRSLVADFCLKGGRG